MNVRPTTLTSTVVTGKALLRRLGLHPDTVQAVAAEVIAHSDWYRRARERGSLEIGDMWGTAAMTVWEVRQQTPFARGGLLRLRVRWALRDLLRAEQKAHGFIRKHGTVRQREEDPMLWPRCACGATVASRQADRCPQCQRVASLSRFKRYRERKKLKATTAA